MALVDGHPRVLTLKQILYYYLKHQEEVITRRTVFELDKAKAKAHILEGLLIALDHIDEVIRTIRESKTDEIAKTALMERFSLSEKQAVAILDMRLRRLTGLERDKIEEDYKEVKERIAYLEDLLSSRDKIMGVIKEELLDEKARFGDARRTEITFDATDLNTLDLIPDEPMIVTLTDQNYVKRMSTDTYRKQGKGGVGVAGMKTKDGDFVKKLITTSTHNRILFFTNKGRVFLLRAVDVLLSNTRAAKGTPIINFLPGLAEGEKVTEMFDMDQVGEAKYLFMITRRGFVKKTEISAYENVRKNGLIAISLRDEDELIAVRPTADHDNVILATHLGMAIRFDESDVRPQGRGAQGVTGIKMKIAGDFVVGGTVVGNEQEILSVSEDGFAKRNLADAYTAQKRGGMGTRNFGKNKKVVGLASVCEYDEVIAVTESGQTIRVPVSNVSVKKAKTVQGVRLMKLPEGDRVASIAVTPTEEDERDYQTTLM